MYYHAQQLQPNCRYSVYVRARSEGGLSDPSNTVEVRGQIKCFPRVKACLGQCSLCFSRQADKRQRVSTALSLSRQTAGCRGTVTGCGVKEQTALRLGAVCKKKALRWGVVQKQNTEMGCGGKGGDAAAPAAAAKQRDR